jgi:hypothetical protein
MADLIVDVTSPGCVRYTLVEDGIIVWRNRVSPDEKGHAGARERMTAWAKAHNVTIVEPQKQPEAQQQQKVIAGRYGRH